jgi:hypothetical protein
MRHERTIRALAAVALAALIATLAIVRYRQEPSVVDRSPHPAPPLALAPPLDLDEIRAAGY